MRIHINPEDHRPRFYDRQGNELADVVAWAELYRDDDYKRVAVDRVGDAMVSTVWLGLDHAGPFGGGPDIFETMVFGGKHSSWQRRYATEEAAVQGHAQVVEALRRGEDPDG